MGHKREERGEEGEPLRSGGEPSRRGGFQGGGKTIPFLVRERCLKCRIERAPVSAHLGDVQGDVLGGVVDEAGLTGGDLGRGEEGGKNRSAEMLFSGARRPEGRAAAAGMVGGGMYSEMRHSSQFRRRRGRRGRQLR